MYICIGSMMRRIKKENKGILNLVLNKNDFSLNYVHSPVELEIKSNYEFEYWGNITLVSNKIGKLQNGHLQDKGFIYVVKSYPYYITGDFSGRIDICDNFLENCSSLNTKYIDFTSVPNLILSDKMTTTFFHKNIYVNQIDIGTPWVLKKNQNYNRDLDKYVYVREGNTNAMTNWKSYDDTHKVWLFHSREILENWVSFTYDDIFHGKTLIFGKTPEINGPFGRKNYLAIHIKTTGDIIELLGTINFIIGVIPKF